ncbi:protoporphyrinogen/coproporphyrinogen oxidase [Leucobacter sp.]
MPADRVEAAGASATGGLSVGTVAVVGGGVSGLVAARELALAGARVTLLEAGDRLGGRLRGETIGGATVDIGAEAFATRGGGVVELLEELGLGDEIVSPAPLGSWVVTGSRAVPLPAAGTIGIPATPLSRDAVRALGVAGALRAAVEPLLPRSAGRGGSLAELVRARLGSRVLERLVRPVVLGVHSTDPADMPVDSVPGLAAAFARRGSLVAAARELRDSRTAAGGAVAGLRAGMTALVEALAAELGRLEVTVRTGASVSALAPRDDRAGWTVTPGDAVASPGAAGDAGSGTEAGAALDVDAVVLAVPESVARRLLGAPPAQPEGRVEVVALLIDDAALDRAPRGTGALVAADVAGTARSRAVPRAAATPIAAKALTHVTAKWPARAAALGAGRHVVRLSYGRVGSAPPTDGLNDDEATRLAIRDASRILGIELRQESVLGMRRREWLAGSSTAGAGIPEPSGIAFAGDWVSGTGLASVIPGARSAARRIMDTTHSDARTAPSTPHRTSRNPSHHEGAQQR